MPRTCTADPTLAVLARRYMAAVREARDLYADDRGGLRRNLAALREVRDLIADERRGSQTRWATIERVQHWVDIQARAKRGAGGLSAAILILRWGW
jgi:hypothetical protein